MKKRPPKLVRQPRYFFWRGGGWWRLCGLCGMEENKKSGCGDVRAKALSWDGEWDKAWKLFSALSPLSPTVDCFAPHSHPSPPEKKAASRKKSRLRRKKTAPAAFLNHEYVTLKGIRDFEKRGGCANDCTFFWVTVLLNIVVTKKIG